MLAGVIPRLVRAAAAVVDPVPPLAIGKIPVTPGLGDALNALSAAVDPRLTNMEGFTVIPVPPLEIGKVVIASSFLPISSKIVVIEFLFSPRAVANLFKVFNVEGALSTKFAIA
jgi:hypothetical protein